MAKHKNVRKKFNYDKNRRKSWRKKKKQPTIACEQIKKAWEEHKSVARNLAEMGLSADPNKTLRILSTKERLDGHNADKYFESVSIEPLKPHVVAALERQAKVKQPSRLDMSDPDVQFCKNMLDKYGDDYVAMSRDKQNCYQDTPKQIKRKIEKFKKIAKFNS